MCSSRVHFKMSLKFAANLNFLFTENGSSLAERIRLACTAGFRAVEIPFTSLEADDVRKAKNDTGIEVALINISLGEGDLRLGSASISGSSERFYKQLEETVQFAESLSCKKIHIMAGLLIGEMDCQIKTYKNNLKYAAQYLKDKNIVGVIEPINVYSLPNYFLNSYEIASEIIRDINSEHLRLMMDIFHLQHIRGNVTYSFKEMKDIIGHIQIAQVPNRHEPDVPGELDYHYIFSLIKDIGYSGWIGCEYKPKSTTIEGLKWLSKFE